MKSIEVTAKKVNDAIEQGLKELGVKIDDVTVEVIEPGGLFRKAKVRLTLDEPEKPSEPEQTEKPAKPEKAEKPAAPEKPVKAEKEVKPDTAKAEKSDKAEKPERTEKVEKAEAAKSEKPVRSEKPVKTEKPEKTEKAESAKAEKPEKKNDRKNPEDKKPTERREADAEALGQACEFVKEVVKKMGFEATVAVNASAETIEITAPQGDDSLIIGRHGETLSAIQYLAETGARAEKHHINIVVDCNGYRDRRAASLSAMAHRKADECIRRNRKIKLEPMERIDRRTVHYALGDDDRVTTASEGKEPYRCVVIIPKK